MEEQPGVLPRNCEIQYRVESSLRNVVEDPPYRNVFADVKLRDFGGN
jgi:hypothetical protein